MSCGFVGAAMIRQHVLRRSVSSEWVVIPAFERSGVEHFFGTKRVCEPRWPGGNTPVATVRQVHGTAVALVRGAGVSREADPAGHDALLTDRPGLPIGISTGDCVPILLHDPASRAVGAIHAGWRGAAVGVLGTVVEMMTKVYGTRSSNLWMAVGPHIGGCCYRVKEDVWEAVASRHPYAREVFRRTEGGESFLLLEGLVARQATELGIPDDRIVSTGLCTSCRGDLFHSYRRDGRLIGGMISAIRLEAA